MTRPLMNTAGTTAFHSIITTQPSAAAAHKNNTGIPTRQSLYLIATPLSFQIVVDTLQTAPQVQDRGALARQQGIDGNPAFLRHLFETPSLKLMLHEHTALIRRQLIQGSLQRFQHCRSRVKRLGTLV